ncbi:MAG TPA: TIGR03809 family protein [Bradyrhizobium sp.]|nr:TIGR03809 family protein [Bradyrhizobium sp.]
MTQVLDVALRRDLVARWCTLAEQRLQHLTDLFESGRWRRYYGERAFLENIKEAKKAVETWRALVSGQPVTRTDDPPGGLARERQPALKPLWRASAPPTESPISDIDLAAEEAPRELTVDLDALEQALIVPPPAADLATMEQRYPLLRNSLL